MWVSSSAAQANRRGRFDETALVDLAASIKSLGLVQPVVVRPLPGPDGEPYQLVAGERRYLAARRAGLQAVPALVRDWSDEKALQAQLVENLQRDDLHELDEASGYEELVKHGWGRGAHSQRSGAFQELRLRPDASAEAEPRSARGVRRGPRQRHRGETAGHGAGADAGESADACGSQARPRDDHPRVRGADRKALPAPPVRGAVRRGRAAGSRAVRRVRPQLVGGPEPGPQGLLLRPHVLRREVRRTHAPPAGRDEGARPRR